MHSIRFRGKRVNDGEWVYGYYLASSDKHYIIDCCGVTSTAIALADSIASFPGYHEVDPETVSQFTGLHDKDGKEICEGDIVSYKNIESEGDILPIETYVDWGVIEYEDGGFKLNNDGEGCIHDEYLGTVVNMERLGHNETLSIIGNIHENNQLDCRRGDGL